MDTAPVNNENVWRKKSISRRSSILKLDRPTLADLDVNKKTETKLSKRSSKRVSFAETYQVKEFPKDSPQRWLRDLQNDITSGSESTTEDKSSGSGQTPTGHEILGLEQLLNGQIQSQGQKEGALNKTVMDGADMEETRCANTTITQNTPLTNPQSDDEDSDVEDEKGYTPSFITKLMKAPLNCDNTPLIKSLEDSDEEEYKASSFFRGGKGGFFSNDVDSDDEEEPVGKIDNKAFLAKLKSINTMSKQFAQETEKRKEKENHTYIFDGLDGETEVTENFTGMLQSIKKRQSVGNVLESTRIFAENDDGMEMTASLPCNLEVVKSNLPISELNTPKGQVSQIGQSKLGTSTLMGRSTNHGLEQTRVFPDYEDPTADMDFTVAGGGILSNTHSLTTRTEADGLQEGEERVGSCPQGTTTPKHATAAVGETNSPSEVTIRFGHQEIDADMEMTEALDPTLIISSSGGGTTMVKKAPDQSSRSHNRALTDVTADFVADGLKTRRAGGRLRIPSVSPEDMEKENITVHFKTADTQGEMDFTACLPTQVEGQNIKGLVSQELTTTSVGLEKTRIFGTSDDGNMELTACLETRDAVQNVTTHIDNTVSFKQKVHQPNRTGNVVPSSSGQNVTRVFGKDDLTAAMELTGCQGMQTVKQPQSNRMCSEEKTRVFDTGEVTAAMELTECVSAKIKRASSEGKTDDKTIHFEQQGGSMELTSCQPGIVSAAQGEAQSETTRVFGATDMTAAMELTECIGAKIKRASSEGKTDDKTIHFEQQGGSMELTSCQPGIVSAAQGEGQSETTRVFGATDMTAAMELTECIGAKIKRASSEGKTDDKTVHFEQQGGSMELTSCQPGIVSAAQVEGQSETTRVFGATDVTAAMEFTECVSAKIKRASSEGKTDDKTIHFEQQGGSMELTSCQPSIVSAAQVEGQSETTRVFGATDVTAAMEFTECVSAKIKRASSEGKTDDKTIHFEQQGGSMELTSCQPSIVSAAQVEAQSETTRVFGATDVTAAMNLTECQPSKVSTGAAEQGDHQESKEVEVTKEGTRGRSGERGRSFPGVCADSVPADKCLQQRRSLYSGSINTAPPQVEGFSTQSLKRKLYSFDMMMAGAKAKTVKVARLNKTENCGDKDRVICPDTNTKVDQSPQVPSADSELASTKAGDMSGTDVPKLSPDHADMTHTATDIQKLSVPDGELSALEFLKMAALEEDTDMLDDTKLLELHMMAKNSKHKANADSLSQEAQSDEGHGLAEKTILEEEDTKSQTIDSEEPPALLLDEDMNLTQHNTTAGLAMILDKMNKSKSLAQTSPAAEKTPGKGGMSGATAAIGKHGSPEPISSAVLKKPKLVDPIVETLADLQLKNNVPVGDSDTVTSLDSANTESSEEHSRGHNSQSAISLSQSLLSFSLLDKYDENDGPWDFGTFCERTGISQFKPKCSRRSSINILPALEADSLQEVLRLQTLTATETQVKEDMYMRLQEEIERDEEEVEEQQRIVSEKEPMLFSQLRNSQITKEEVHSCYKACQRSAKAKMKRERVAISKQCLHKLQEEKERLCIGVNEVMTRAERVISDLASIDNMLADIDSQLEELGEEPAVTETEAEEVARLKEHLFIKTQEFRKSEEERAQALRQRSELMQRQSDLEAEVQRQEMQMLEGTHTSDGLGELDMLQNRLEALHRVLEWRVKEMSPTRDVFLFLYGGVEISVTYDLVQHKTVDSVVLKTHLADSSSPWSHLASRLVIGGVDCQKLRNRYSSRDKLPQMLNEISRLTAGARNLASQISDADLKHSVAIDDFGVSVSILNTRWVRKVVVTFMLEPSTCKAVDCSVDVVIGTITKETVADVIKETICGPEFLTKSISRVQSLLDR